MTAPGKIGRPVVIFLTKMRGRELDALLAEKRFPMPARESGREVWDRSEVLAWVEGDWKAAPARLAAY